MPDWVIASLAVLGALDLACTIFIITLALCAGQSAGRKFHA